MHHQGSSSTRELWELPRETLAAPQRARKAWRTTKRKARRSRTTAPTTATSAWRHPFAVPAAAAAWSNRTGSSSSRNAAFVSRRRCMCPRRPSGAGQTASTSRNENAAGAGAQDWRERTGPRAVVLGSRKPREERRICARNSRAAKRARSPRGALCAGGVGRRPSALRAPRLEPRACTPHTTSEKFMREKPPDVKGGVSLRGRRACRFGRRCRFYGSHEAAIVDAFPISRNLVSEEIKTRYPTRRSGPRGGLPVPFAAVRRRAPRDGRPGEVRVADASRAPASLRRREKHETNTRRRIPEAKDFTSEKGTSARASRGGQFRPGVLPPDFRGAGPSSRL